VIFLPEELINIGRVVATQGNKGEVKVISLTDFPDRFRNLKRVYLVQRGKEPITVEIEKAWHHKGFIILKIKGYDSISQAEELKGTFISIPEEERIKLRKDEYYIDEIIGLEVESEEGERLGEIIDIIRNPGNDIYVIKNDRELWIPATKEVVKRIDLENRKITIHMMEGLESL
jgi:16S rRNA processing protein RimM